MAESSKPTLSLAELISSIYDKDQDAIKVVVVSENRPPTNILLSNSDIDSGTTSGTRIGILTVVDPNSEDTHLLEIVEDIDNKFTIENPQTSTSTTSFLVLKDDVDYATKQSHDVIIRATDPTELSITIKFTINVIANFQNVTSIELNGIDEYLTGGDIHDYDVAQAFSISMWVKPNNIAASQILFSKATNDGLVNGYMFRFNATTGQLFLQMRTSSLNRNHTFDTAVTASEWQLIVFTYSGASNISGASTYRNGVKNVTAPSGSLGGTMLFGQPFIIGQRNNSFGFYSGKTDEVSVWDKELTQVEIDEIYNSGVPSDLSMHSAEGNLQSWYRFDDDVIPTILDHVNSDDLTAVNMDSNNLTTDVPS